MQPYAINTFRALIRDGYSVSAHCNDPFCRHSVELDLPALAERLGLDFVTVGDPNPLAAKLRCAKCGGKDIGLILSAPNGYQGRQRLANTGK